MVPKPSTKLEWDGDPDLPELEEIEEIEKRELEKVRQERVMAREVCMEITLEMVTKVEAVSVAENMMGCGGDGMGWH